MPHSVEMIHTMWCRNDNYLGVFTRSNSRINRGKERVSNMIWDERESSRKMMLNDIPRTALADVDAAKILLPFSNSRDPLFQDIIPCCIHFGKFSYAVCNLQKCPLRLAGVIRIPILTLSLKTA